MKQSIQSNRKKHLLLLCFLLAWLMVIWGHSFQPAAVSAAESGAALKYLQSILQFLPAEVREYFIRKCAHFTEFTILGILLVAVFTTSRIVWRKIAFYDIARLLALFAGLLTAMIDESIQYFSPGRSCEVRDVWLDFAGVICGTVIISVICHVRQQKSEKKEK